MPRMWKEKFLQTKTYTLTIKTVVDLTTVFCVIIGTSAPVLARHLSIHLREGTETLPYKVFIPILISYHHINYNLYDEITTGRCGHRPVHFYSNVTWMLLSVDVTRILFITVPRLSIISVETLSSIFLRITLRRSLAPRTLPSIFDTIADGVLSS